MALTQGADGALYGVSVGGGPSGLGTIFKVTGTGTVSVLHTFGGVDGSSPDCRLLSAANGFLYGTCQNGGSHGDGVLFRITDAGQYEVIHNFDGAGGSARAGSLTQLPSGTIAGVAATGGANGQGIVFGISPEGSYHTIYSFAPGTADGQNPSGGVVLGSDGDLYGVTYDGGANGDGTIFSLTLSGTESYLYSFSGNDGINPAAPLTVASDGKMYGTCQFGGGAQGAGTAFSIDTSHNVVQLYQFGTQATDGAEPSGVVQASDGLLYGVCAYGGANGVGTLFSLTTAGTEVTVDAFDESSGGMGAPNADVGLCADTDGYLFGVTQDGGPVQLGEAFAYKPGGAVSTVAPFVYNSKAGNGPAGALVLMANGALSGLTSSGGQYNDGTLFQTTPAGAVTYTYYFGGPTGPLFTPTGQPAVGTASTLFGMAQDGGSGYGGIWTLTGNGFASVESFDFTHGAGPTGLIADASGNLFGTTSSGGSAGFGTVFEIPKGGAISVLHSFTGSTADGSMPQGEFVLAADGYLYGTTEFGGTHNVGTVYRIKPNGTAFALVHSFSGPDGEYPTAGLTIHTNKSLYGVAAAGGGGGNGVIFSISPSLAYADIHDMASSGLDGEYPETALMEGPDQYLYGAADSGGLGGNGTLFRISPANRYSVLHAFSAPADGSSPNGALALAANGDLYGTTTSGGPGATAAGTLFRLRTRFYDHDFNHDTNPDLIWQNTTTGEVDLWTLNGLQTLAISVVTKAVSAVWNVFSVADINGDGSPDLVFWNSSTGAVDYWTMKGTVATGSGTIATSSNLAWRPITFADVTGSGSPSLLWQNQTTGQLQYTVVTAGVAGATIPLPYTIPATQHLVAAVDLNADGWPDLIFQDSATNTVSYWLMNGTAELSQGVLVQGVSSATWAVIGMLDTNHDFQPDLLWQNKTTGAVVCYQLNGLTATPTGYITKSQPTNMRAIAR